MNQPQVEQPKPVTHLIVSAEAYQAVLNVLSDLPYKTAAPVLNTLQQGTKPFEQGSIVDDGGEEGAES